MTVWTAAGCRRRDRARRGVARGAVALEFALVASALAMLLLGTVTTGFSYARAIGMTNAVREGARFGATADAAQPTWASDVITRVRQTEYDASAGDTAVCVQLLKQPASGPAVPVSSGTTACDLGSGPTLSTTDGPAAPTLATVGQCVVRVVAARTYSVTLVVAPAITRTAIRSSFAQYERGAC